MFQRTISKRTAALNGLVGETASHYQFKEVLQEKENLQRVWMATSGQQQFVLKHIPNYIFSSFNLKIRPRLHESPYQRLPCDIIHNERIFVYKYMKDDFLSLVKKGISMGSRKQVLENVLLGIAELHDRHIIHLDIKPDNIIVDCHHNGQQTIIEQARIIDLDNVSYLPKLWCLKGMAAGNENWCSSEAHFRARLNKPTDIFSFGAVIGVYGTLKHLVDYKLCREILSILWEDRLEGNIPYRSFYEWPDVVSFDPLSQDLVSQLMSLDPKRRVTAREALEHPWFADV